MSRIETPPRTTAIFFTQNSVFLDNIYRAIFFVCCVVGIIKIDHMATTVCLF